MYNEINELFDEMNKAFENAYKEIKNPILVNVMKRDDAYLVEAALPGVAKENVKLTAKDSKLTISVADTKDDTKENKFVVKERISNYNPRTIFLRDMDETSITAKMENGILSINVPFVKKHTSEIVID